MGLLVFKVWFTGFLVTAFVAGASFKSEKELEAYAAPITLAAIFWPIVLCVVIVLTLAAVPVFLGHGARCLFVSLMLRVRAKKV